MIELFVQSSKRNELLDITSQVAGAVLKSGVKSGICIVYIPHTTAGVTINEGRDPDVALDILKKLSKLVPENESFYNHAEGNSDSHIKALLTGSSVMIPIQNGSPALGTWQKIFFCEYDGPRRRKFYIKIMEDKT